MEQFIINGPTRLKGKVKVAGSKNAALPIIASSILFEDQVILKNVPAIKDVLTMIEILRGLGAKCDFKNNILSIDPRNIKNEDPNSKIVRHIRSSILFLAPLLVRNKKVKIPHPGGCLIGARPVDVHLGAFKQMGASVRTENSDYEISAPKLKSATITADFSVTGTENIIMASVLTEGETVVNLAAAEPHVQDLCYFLKKAGAKIEGIGTHTLKIIGVKKLNKIDYEICPDQIESGTFAIAAAVSKGEVEIEGFVAEHHTSLLSKFDKAKIPYEIINPQKIKILPSHIIEPFKIRTEIYPGFPTDLQAPMAVLATQADGTSEIYETIFEGRLGYIAELSKMGANAVIRDAHQATITGPTPLTGTRITSFDLRAGATLIIAALIARGESRLDQIEMIDRGYENIEEKFRSLGADIKRVALREVE